MALLKSRPVRVQPFFGYRSRDRLVLGARAMRSPLPRFAPGTRLGAIRTMLSLFASRKAAGVAVRLAGSWITRSMS